MALSGSAKLILTVALAITIGIIVLQPVISATNDNTGVQSVSGENVTADHGNWSSLSGWDVQSGTVVVEDQSGTTTYSEGSDYEINLTEGELKALSSGTISDGETLNVSYDYQATDGMTEMVVGFVPVMFGVLMIVAATRAIQQKM